MTRAVVTGAAGFLGRAFTDGLEEAGYDVVSGGLAAATRDAGIGEVFNLTSGRGVPARRFFRPYADALGVPLRTAPKSVVVAVGAAVESAYRLMGRPPPVTSGAAEYVAHTGVCSIDRAHRLLGWSPRVELDEGMRRTLEWASRAGLLERR